MAYEKPIPVPSESTVPFWEAARQGALKLQRCTDCGAFRCPPSVICPECSSTTGEWQAVSGRGKVYSYVIFHRAYHPGFAGELPYAVACIELNEGPRLLSNVIGIPADQVRCDMPVEVVFESITPEISLPKFRPIA